MITLTWQSFSFCFWRERYRSPNLIDVNKEGLLAGQGIERYGGAPESGRDQALATTVTARGSHIYGRIRRWGIFPT